MKMTSGWLSIAFACALGALIGTLTALEISIRFEYGSSLWGIGALAGGIAAYVAIDFRHFCSGVAHSYHSTITWRPDRLWWKAFGTFAGGTVTTVCSLSALVCPVFVFFNDDIPMSGILFTLYCVLWISAFAVLYAWGVIAMILQSEKDASPARRDELLSSIVETGKSLFLKFNPIAVTVAALRGLKKAAVESPPAIKRAVPTVITRGREVWRATSQFAVSVFVFIHSQRRTVCFVDATIGAVIGYSFGSAIIGAVTGAILGVINYEIVSVRLLRVTPNR